jgi:hypothetical protein
MIIPLKADIKLNRPLAVLIALFIILSTGCLTIGTHIEGSKASLDFTVDLATINKRLGILLPIFGIEPKTEND